MALPSLAFDGFGYQSYTAEHMDLGVRIVDDEYVGFWKNDGAIINGQTTPANDDRPAAGLRAMGIFDDNRLPFVRPAGDQWNFLGVDAGAPIYILPAQRDPLLPYLGWSTEDDSLADDGADEYRFTLVDMTGPEDSVFSVYTSSANVPMNTLAGFPAGSLLIGDGSHLHFNMAFSHPGTYDLYFQFEALDGGAVIATGQDMFRFQIVDKINDNGGFDSYEHWRRTVFTPVQIADETISGPSAAPLEDGISNLQRYAFGDDASVNFMWLEDNGTPVPGIEARMRFSSGDVMPVAEFSPQLVPPDWSDTSLLLVDQEPIHHDPGMEIRTYRVDHPESATGFLRLRSTP